MVAQPGTKAPRDGYIDTVRGLLIVLVVVGHFLELSAGWDSGARRALLTVIYLFHMPLFVFLTGLTARSTRLPDRLLRTATLLITAQAAYLLVHALLAGTVPDIWSPYWLLWFLMCLFWWQLLLPLIERFPRAAMAAAVGGALLVGLVPVPGNVLAYSRALVFLPFFVIGHLHGARILSALRGRWRAGIALGAAFAAVALVTYLARPEPHWLFGNWSYEWLGVQPAEGMLLRIAVLAAGMLGSAAFLALSPVSDRIQVVGRRSLAVFLLHGFVVLLVARLLPPGSGTVSLMLALAGPLLAAFLSIPLFDRALRSLSELPERALRRRATADVLSRPGVRG